jgi:hypothetical protein
MVRAKIRFATEPQNFGWPAIQSGAHTLIAAPTGDEHRIRGTLVIAAKISAEDFSKNGNDDLPSRNRDDALEIFAKILLRRYGVMFRKLLEREALKVSWFELGRIYRRLEAHGEIRGGYFINGVSGE